MSHLCTLTLRDDKELNFQYYFVYTAARREVSRRR